MDSAYVDMIADRYMPSRFLPDHLTRSTGQVIGSPLFVIHVSPVQTNARERGLCFFRSCMTNNITRGGYLMKTVRIFMYGLLALMFMSGPAMADKGPHMGMMGDKDGQHMMYRDHHDMSMEMMKMMKEVMGIVKNLEHRPSAAEKEKLDKMMSRLDEMMQQHEDMMKKAREMHEERMEKWKEHHRMMDNDMNDDEDDNEDNEDDSMM